MTLSVFELKKRVVLALFNYWPEAFSYTCKTRCKESYSLRVALQKLDYPLQKIGETTWDTATKCNAFQLNRTDKFFLSRLINPQHIIKKGMGREGHLGEVP